jgi:outer membrane protein OmpA-like peptidoglycan-associated protein
MVPSRLLPVALALASVSAVPVAAQDFGRIRGNTVERAVESEVRNRVDRETRRITRCVMGDDRCIREARERGDDIEIDRSGAGVSGVVQAGGDHALITPYAGSTLREREDPGHAAYPRITGYRDGQVVTETVEGNLTRLTYDNPGGRSPLEIVRNYRQALEAQGFRTDWECGSRQACGSTARHGGGRGWNGVNGMNLGAGGNVHYVTGSMPHGQGTAWVSIGATPRQTRIHIVEGAAMQTGMVQVNAAQLAAELDRSGRVTLDGIHFDTGQDTLRPESDAALAQVGLLMRDDPALRLMVEGHTDSTGSMEVNQTLSQRRANRVREAIIARYGVAPDRLGAAGYGAGRPVADHAPEQGRALTGRVELVRK